MSRDNTSTVMRFGVFEAHLRGGELRKQGVRIKIQERPYHVLSVLLERHGEVVTPEELHIQNWPADAFVDFDNSLNTAINKVREALGDSAENPRFGRITGKPDRADCGRVADWPLQHGFAV